MNIQWLRVLAGGFLIEVLLAVVLIGGFVAAGISLNVITTGMALVIGVGCLVISFLVVLWLGRGVTSHLLLHGFLIGLVATIIYLGLVAGAGQMPSALASYGPATFVTLNVIRILGAVLGALACERRRSTAHST